LKDDELQQLHALLIRYLYDHASGLANMTIDGVIHALYKKLGHAGQPQQWRPIEYSSEELLLLLG
jgi:hypothetical protein